jgi:hypothetical protein
VKRGRFRGAPLTYQPLVLQDALVGRAFGRIVAHEIGHWLLGPQHTETGLMKRSLSPDELLEQRPSYLDSTQLPVGQAVRTVGPSVRQG